MPLRLQNTFAPSTPLGAGLQSLAGAMFGTQGATPLDNAEMKYRNALTQKAQMEAAGAEIENQQARRQYEQSDPSRIPDIAATISGMTVPEGRQEAEFLQQGVPYARGTTDPGVADQFRNAYSNLQAMPFMTGDTRLDQFQDAVQTGRQGQRDEQLYAGELAPEQMAQERAAMEGEPMFGVQGNTLLNLFKGQMEPTAVGESMIAENRAQAQEARAGASGESDATAALQTRRGKINDALRVYGPRWTAEGLSDRQQLERATALVDNYERTSRDPVSGEAMLINEALGSGRYPTIDDGSGAPPPQQQPQAGEQTADGQPGSVADDMFSTLPGGVDYSAATGGSGFIGNLLNTTMGVFGGQYDPEAERGGQGLKNLQVRTQTGLQQSIPGRPSNYLMQQLGALTVEPYSVLQGDARAKERLSQTRDMIETELQRMDRDILARPRDYTPQQIAETRSNKSILEGLLRDYETALEGYGGGRQLSPQEGQQAGGGGEQFVDTLPDPSTYPEGTEADNPDTGEVFIIRNGQWVSP